VDTVSSLDSNIFIDAMSGICNGRFNVHHRVLDGGAVQNGPLCIDGVATLQRYYDSVHIQHSDLLNAEVNFLKEIGCEIVISDATPIACRAGNIAGCKVCILSNFTWDFCYLEMLEEVKGSLDTSTIEKYANMIECCAADYSCADMYIQLPGATPLPNGFNSSRLVIGPLIAGISECQARSTRSALGLDSSSKVLLLGFGGHTAQWSLKDSYLPSGWVCLVLGATETDMPSSRFKSIGFDCVVPDLISIADVALGKLGYGFMSECLSNGTPLVYVSRSCWPEEKYLQLYMTERNACIEMTATEYSSGMWERALTEALELKAHMSCASYRDEKAVVKAVDTIINST